MQKYNNFVFVVVGVLKMFTGELAIFKKLVLMLFRRLFNLIFLVVFFAIIRPVCAWNGILQEQLKERRQ